MADKIKITEQKPTCPSFEDEPWKAGLEKLKKEHPQDQYMTIDWSSTKTPPAPLPNNHWYVKYYLEFLNTVPKECWVDEENEVD